MYKHILVPIKMEPDVNSERALSIAKLMAGRDGKITLLHVIEQIPSYATTYFPADYLTELHKTTAADLAAIAAPLRNGSSVVIEGHSGRSILEWGAEHGVDCIVVASHIPVVSDYLIGSTAAHIVRHAKCSVHVVR